MGYESRNVEASVEGGEAFLALSARVSHTDAVRTIIATRREWGMGPRRFVGL
jgi:hypothetical protein